MVLVDERVRTKLFQGIQRPRLSRAHAGRPAAATFPCKVGNPGERDVGGCGGGGVAGLEIEKSRYA